MKSLVRKKDAPTPKSASPLSTITLDTITIDDALKLLSLTRNLGVDSETGEETTVQNGRYGPCLKRGHDSRTQTTEEQLFSIDFDEAVEIYKQQKVHRRGVAKPPLRELGVDPGTNKLIIIKDGRLGMYVTDGETNTALRRGDTVEAMTIERALDLLAGRRTWEIENGCAPKKSKRAKKTAPTLTEKTIKYAGSRRKAKKSATGKSENS